MIEPTIQSTEKSPLSEEERRLRIGLARVYNTITSRAKTDSIASISMADLIAEQIFWLDSSQVDVASQVSEEESEAARLELERAQGMVGYKQRLERLNDMMTGADGNGGLIASARAFEGVVADDAVAAEEDSSGAADGAADAAAAGSPLYPSVGEAPKYQGGS